MSWQKGEGYFSVKQGQGISISVSHYAVFLRWLLLDSLWRRKWMVSIVFALGLLGVLFQVKVFALVIYYARHFSSGSSIDIVGYVIDPRASTGLLATGCSLVFIFLSLAALCIYFSRRGALRMGREYEEFCAKRVFYLLGGAENSLSVAEAGPNSDSFIARLVRGDSRLVGRILRMLLSMIVPGLTLVTTTTVLFYLEPTLTVLITVLAVLFVFIQAHTSRRAAGHSMRFEKLTSAAGGQYKELIQYYKYHSRPGESQSPVERIFSHGIVKKQLDAYVGRLQSVETSRLVSGLFMALVVSLLILIMGVSIINEGTGWERLLVYVVALRFAMVALQNTFSSITVINRFYPQAKRYFLFVQSLSDQSRNFSQYTDDPYEILADKITASGLLANSAKRLEIDKGVRIALVTFLELNRYTVPVLVSGLLGREDEVCKGVLKSLGFVTAKPACHGVSMRALLNLDQSIVWNDLNAWFPNQLLWEKARKELPDNLDKEMNLKLWENVSSDVRFIVGLLAACRSSKGWLLIDVTGLNNLTTEESEFYLNKMRDRVVILVHNQSKRIGSSGESIVAVFLENGVIGLGDSLWFANVKSSVDMLLAEKIKTAHREVKEDEEDEEEF
jgi:hypothetical protein